MCSIRTKLNVYYNFEPPTDDPVYRLRCLRIRKQATHRTGPASNRLLKMTLKASHTLSAGRRKAISVTERQRFILRVRTLARAVAHAYYNARGCPGFSPVSTGCSQEAAHG